MIQKNTLYKISWSFKTWNSNVYIHTFEFWMKTFESEIIKALSMKEDYRQVQNDCKNTMTTDISKFTINVLYQRDPDFFLPWRYGL